MEHLLTGESLVHHLSQENNKTIKATHQEATCQLVGKNQLEVFYERFKNYLLCSCCVYIDGRVWVCRWDSRGSRGDGKKAIAFYKANGQEKAFAEISNPKGQFIKDDLYVFVYDIKGKCVAHGFNQKMVGKDLIDLKDADGKFFVKERIEIVKKSGKGWQDYMFTNPTTKKIEHKTAYVEKTDDFIFGCGAYKK